MRGTGSKAPLTYVFPSSSNVEQITAYAQAKAANETILVYPGVMSVALDSMSCWEREKISLGL